MKVLSLFDGMSCGQYTLNKLGLPIEKYYASEIDKYAIQVSQANYPDIEQVGDICNLNPKDYKDIDLILAGSPCQGFSFAGKQLARRRLVVYECANGIAFDNSAFLRELVLVLTRRNIYEWCKQTPFAPLLLHVVSIFVFELTSRK